MNYFRIYNSIINRAKTRILEVYSENHHIVPKCMGGTNCKTNLVRLTPEEHYLAHQLLVKMYPDNKKLVYAAAIMCHSTNTMSRGNRLYGWIRRALSETRRNVPKSDEHKKKLSLSNKGQVVSVETRAKMSLARMGNKNGCGGKGVKKSPRTQEHKDNLGKSLRKSKSEEGKENIGLGAIKRSIGIIMEKRDLYITFYKMYDGNYTKQEIKECLNVRERAYYSYISNRTNIENIIKEYSDAQ